MAKFDFMCQTINHTASFLIDVIRFNPREVSILMEIRIDRKRLCGENTAKHSNIIHFNYRDSASLSTFVSAQKPHSKFMITLKQPMRYNASIISLFTYGQNLYNTTSVWFTVIISIETVGVHLSKYAHTNDRNGNIETSYRDFRIEWKSEKKSKQLCGKTYHLLQFIYP